MSSGYRRSPVSTILIIGMVLYLLGVPTVGVRAHANLLRSDPPANARLASAPAMIQLWFSEPLEPTFLRVQVFDSQGALIDTPAPHIDPTDSASLMLMPGALPEGVITIAWRVVSATDGHPTQGSFPIIIGTTNASAIAVSIPTAAPLPLDSAAARALTFFSLALLVGIPLFVVRVWRATIPEGEPATERVLRHLCWVAWALYGMALGALLWLQSAALFTTTLDLSLLVQTITSTRFGGVWSIRALIWLIVAVLLATRRRFAILLIAGGALILAQASFGHAVGTPDPALAMTANAVHLLAASAWIGGLVGLLVVGFALRRVLPVLAGLVARYSLIARLAVGLLVITGTYAAWVHVGTIEALTSTAYGHALIVKLLFFAPLLALGAVNSVITARGLRSHDMIWSLRLRILVGAELLLAVGVLGAVGLMTATTPARITQANSIPAPIAPDLPMDMSFFEMIARDQVMVHLTITPGTIGENEFSVALYDETTLDPITDATLIRLRFQHESGAIGESELRPQPQGDGIYSINGANLSLPGRWRIRATIQRPGAYDTVVDFEPVIAAPMP